MKSFNIVLTVVLAAVISQLPQTTTAATPSYTYECEGDEGQGQGEELCLAVPADEKPAKGAAGESTQTAAADTTKSVIFGAVDEQAALAKNKKPGLPTRGQPAANALQSMRAAEKFGHADSYAQQTREQLDQQLQRLQEIERLNEIARKKKESDAATSQQ